MKKEGPYSKEIDVITDVINKVLPKNTGVIMIVADGTGTNFVSNINDPKMRRDLFEKGRILLDRAEKE